MSMRGPIVWLFVQTCCAMTWSPAQAQSPVTVTPEEVELFTRPPVNEKLHLFRGEIVCIPTEVFGEKIIASVNTGSSNGSIDSSYRHRLEKLSKVVESSSPTGLHSWELYRSPPMKIGATYSIPFENIDPVLCYDMANLREASGIGLKAIIGMSFLKNYVLRLNFDDKIAAIQSSVSSREGHKISVDIVYGPYIKIQVSDTGLQEFLVVTADTGGITLENALFDRLCERGRITLYRGSYVSASVGGNVEVRCGTIDSVELGPYCFRNVHVDEGNKNKLGLRFLERFETEFDFPNRRAYFRPGKLLHRANHFDPSGVALLQSPQGIEIWDVQPKSAGEVAGLKKGDLIVEVNGRPAHGMTLSEARNLFDQDDTELPVTVERDGQRVSTTLKRVKIPDPVPSIATDDSP